MPIVYTLYLCVPRSGSMANLEIALQLIGRGTNPENKVLFAFWAAEEWGLMGSRHYVQSLPVSAYRDIALNLNFDMIVSKRLICTWIMHALVYFLGVAKLHQKNL